MSNLLKKIKGYTLIETAMVLVVAGMMIGTLASVYTLYIKDKDHRETNAAVESATKALIAYASMYGKYPCPSQPNIGRGQPGHGMELCAPNNDILNPISAAGNCFEYSTSADTLTEGLCVEESTAPVTDKRILRGSIPFKALNIPENQTIDQYGYKISYAVTYSMTNKDTFSLQSGESGAVLLVDDNDNVITGGTDGAHFYVFSSGKNGAGAYTREGILSSACPASPAQENENCDILSGDGIYRHALKSEREGSTFFDDQGSYYARLNIQHWEYLDENSDDIVHKLPGKLIIGAPIASDITTASKVDVSGAVYVDGGVLLSDQICDKTAGHADTNPACFTSEMIAGKTVDGKGLLCPRDDIDGVGQYMVGIQNGRVICEDEIYVSCAGGTFVKEIKTDGTVVCSAPPPASCPPMTLTLCGRDITVGTRIDGQYGYWISGTCYEMDTPTTSPLVAENCNMYGRRYKCSDGNWISQSWYRNNYPCTCTEQYRTINNGQCIVGYTGTQVRTQKYRCPERNWVWYTPTSTEGCTCDPGAIDDRPYACPPGLIGQPKSRYVMDCSTETWIYQGEVGTACTCPWYEDIVNTLGCADGFSGEYEVNTKWVCPDGVGGPTAGFWDSVNTITIDTCECDSSYFEYETDPCPAGEVGTIQMKYKREWICDSSSSGHFAPRTLEVNDCVPIAPPVCHWESNSTATATEQPIGNGRLGDSCNCGVDTAPIGCYTGGSGSAQFYSACSCK
jgi:type II secretory pathway pseudopilin PulG